MRASGLVLAVLLGFSTAVSVLAVPAGESSADTTGIGPPTDPPTLHGVVIAVAEPRVVDLQSHGNFVKVKFPWLDEAGTGATPVRAETEYGAVADVIVLGYSRPDLAGEFRLDRGELIDYLASLDPRFIVGGYNLRFTLFLSDGGAARGLAPLEVVDHRPMLLVRVPRVDDTAVLIGRNLRGHGAVEEVRFGGVPALIVETPVSGNYPGIGAVEVFRVRPPPNAMLFEVEATTREGTTTNTLPAEPTAPAGPPRLFLVLPSSGPPGWPVLVTGTGFDVGAIPYFGLPGGTLVPGAPIITVSVQNFPLLGSVSATVTFVPAAAPPGNSAVQVEYLGKMSNPFPITVQ